MSKNNACSNSDEKLKHYAAMAARMDEKLERIIGRGAFTSITLDRLSAAPLTNIDDPAAEQLSIARNTSVAPSASNDSQVSTARFPASFTPPIHFSRMEGNHQTSSSGTTSVIGLLSVVCEILLPLHSMMPLAQQISRSAVIWYLSSNVPGGIQVYKSTFRQAINIRYNKDLQHNYSRNRIINLPPPRYIALHLRIIFRILKLPPDDGKDGYH